MHHYRLLVLLLIITPGLLFAQQPREKSKAYQLSGLIISEGEQESIPYVRIQINHTRHGVVSNVEGFYSVPVKDTDTLYFHHLGYHSSQLVVKDYIDEYKVESSQYIYAINYMKEDTFTLPTVNIFPYNTPEELKTAVVNMDGELDPMAENARENLDPTVMHAIMQSLPIDSDERLMVGRQMYYNYYQNKNLAQTASIDPIAAARLLQYIAEKARKKRNKDLNYWE